MTANAGKPRKGNVDRLASKSTDNDNDKKHGHPGISRNDRIPDSPARQSKWLVLFDTIVRPFMDGVARLPPGADREVADGPMDPDRVGLDQAGRGQSVRPTEAAAGPGSAGHVP